jgi:putative flippase GtrA
MRTPVRPAVAREMLAFAAIGVVSTAAYGALYLLLRTALEPTGANALALLVTAIGNTAANRRLTFRVRSRRSMLRDQLGGLLALAIALAITTASIAMLDTTAPHAPRLVELAILVAANAAATIVRFLVLRTVIAGHPIPARPALDPDPLWSRP